MNVPLPAERPSRRIVFSARARADTFAIWDDLATAGDRWGSSPVDPIDDADAFAGRLSAACQRVADDPGCGVPCDAIAGEIRVVELGQLGVYYRDGSRGIEVVRVLRGPVR